jgi:hypothetical protein
VGASLIRCFAVGRDPFSTLQILSRTCLENLNSSALEYLVSSSVCCSFHWCLITSSCYLHIEKNIEGMFPKGLKLEGCNFGECVYQSEYPLRDLNDVGERRTH